MRIGLVIPTVQGREQVLDHVLERYAATCADDVEYEVVIPENYPCCGEAWNKGYKDVADCDYVFFTLDDLEPHRGWEEIAAATVEEGFTPAPHQLQPDGSVESCGSMGLGAVIKQAKDRTPCRNAGVIFTTPEWYERVGEFLPIHYAVDDDWHWRSALAGRVVLYRSEMIFTHHGVLTNTDHVRAQAQDHIQEFVKNAAHQRLPSEAAV